MDTLFLLTIYESDVNFKKLVKVLPLEAKEALLELKFSDFITS